MHLRAVESQRFSGGFGVTFIWNILSSAAHSLPYIQGLEDGGAAASMPRFYCRVGWRIKIDWVCSKDDKSLEDTIVGVGGCDYLQWGILSYLNKSMCRIPNTERKVSPLPCFGVLSCQRHICFSFFCTFAFTNSVLHWFLQASAASASSKNPSLNGGQFCISVLQGF